MGIKVGKSGHVQCHGDSPTQKNELRRGWRYAILRGVKGHHRLYLPRFPAQDVTRVVNYIGPTFDRRRMLVWGHGPQTRSRVRVYGTESLQVPQSIDTIRSS